MLSVDEKSQCQALERSQPILPLQAGIPEQQTHGYIRHGTTTLFAALEVATGRVGADACYRRHRHQEFLAFLKKVAAAYPDGELHIVWACTLLPTARGSPATPTNTRSMFWLRTCTTADT